MSHASPVLVRDGSNPIGQNERCLFDDADRDA
jgi:hypothetical protein